VNRRAFLRLLGITTAGAALTTVAGCRGPARSGALLTSQVPLPERFTVPLPRPAVAQPGPDGVYDLVQRAAMVEILPATRTEVWGYGGTFPGPTFDVRRGAAIRVRVTNELPVPTSTHLHGGVTPAEFDGYPTHLIVPAGLTGPDLRSTVHSGHGGHAVGWRLVDRTFTYEYPLDQPAATLWYHDHRMDFTGPQVYRGLAGLFLIRDDIEDALPLPRGDRELPLVICDRAFAADGSFRYPSVDPTLLHERGVAGAYHQGVLGDVILVNGAPWPTAEVAGARYRLRILNASNARRYDLRLDPPPPTGPAFTQIGSDVGLLAAPQPLDRVLLASGERADVIVDFSTYPAGTPVVLRNALGQWSTVDVMRFVVGRATVDDSVIPPALAPVETLAPAAAVTRRRFDFRLSGPGEHGRQWTINGTPFDPATAVASPVLGTTELWTITSDFHHPVHVHLGHFQVLSRNGRAPGPADAGWKDTVDIRPYEVVQLLVRFTGYRGRYVLHCHNLEHEDMAMMANIDVV